MPFINVAGDDHPHEFDRLVLRPKSIEGVRKVGEGYGDVEIVGFPWDRIIGYSAQDKKNIQVEP